MDSYIGNVNILKEIPPVSYDIKTLKSVIFFFFFLDLWTDWHYFQFLRVQTIFQNDNSIKLIAIIGINSSNNIYLMTLRLIYPRAIEK